jgi:anaerobic selenocysteine-containing dehydrogenase
MKLNFPWKNVEEYNDYRLKPLNLRFRELKRKGNYIETAKQYGWYRKNGFPTPSGKIELYSSLFEKYGYDPLPTHKEPPQTTSEYPLIMVSGDRTLEYWNTEGRQIMMLREIRPDPVVEVNPETAGKMGINNREWVYIESIYFKNEKVKFKVKLTHDVHPKVIHAEHGWWFPEKPGPEHGCFESNVNLIIPDDVYDHIIGSPNMKSVPCKMYKV